MGASQHALKGCSLYGVKTLQIIPTMLLDELLSVLYVHVLGVRCEDKLKVSAEHDRLDQEPPARKFSDQGIRDGADCKRYRCQSRLLSGPTEETPVHWS